MDVLSFLWLAGEAAALTGLLAGACLSIIAREPFFGWYTERAANHVGDPEAHKPFNHRLLLEAEW